MRANERLIIYDEGADLLRETVLREPLPPLQLMPIFVPLGAGRGEWERAREVEVEYIAPGRAA